MLQTWAKVAVWILCIRKFIGDWKVSDVKDAFHQRCLRLIDVQINDVLFDGRDLCNVKTYINLATEEGLMRTFLDTAKSMIRYLWRSRWKIWFKEKGREILEEKNAARTVVLEYNTSLNVERFKLY